MKKFKILRIITRMNIGGPAIQAAMLTAGIDKEDFSSTLVAGPVGGSEGDMTYLASEKGIEPLIVNELKREPDIINDIIGFFKLYAIIKKEKPDIVHTHMAKAGTLGRLAAAIAGVPVIIHTYHGHVFHSYFNPLKTRFFLAVEKILARFTDRIIVISRRQRDEIKRYLGLRDDSKLVLIPLGFELGRFLEGDREDARDRMREKWHIPKDAVVVGTVGRLTAVKNHKMFIRAAREIKRKFTDKNIRFLIVGDGELRTSLVKLSDSLGLGGDVIFTGWKKHVEEAYCAMDIVALTSLNEGTPVSIIEALANARPVVATDVGGVRDVAEDGKCGFVVPKNDIRAFTEAASALISDRDKRAVFSSYGRDFIRERHSKERLIKDIEDLYHNELRRKGRNSA